jgi:hypothetical protein
VALLLICPEALYAQEQRAPGTGPAVEASAGNSVLQLRYLTPSRIAGPRSDLDYGFLLSEGRDMIASAALMFRTDVQVIPRLTFAVGPQGYLALLDAVQKTDVFALSLGASARYELIRSRGIVLFGSAFYSPGVLTFGNAHNLYDFTVGGEVSFATRLSGLVGYRWLKVTTVGEPDVRVENELFAGLLWYPQ